MYIQVPQVAMNLVFTYTGRDFAPHIPFLLSLHSRGVGREVVVEDRQKNSWVSWPSPDPLSPVFQHCILGSYAFFDLPFVVVSLHSLSLVDPHHSYLYLFIFHTSLQVCRQEAEFFGGDMAGGQLKGEGCFLPTSLSSQSLTELSHVLLLLLPWPISRVLGVGKQGRADPQ